MRHTFVAGCHRIFHHDRLFISLHKLFTPSDSDSRPSYYLRHVTIVSTANIKGTGRQTDRVTHVAWPTRGNTRAFTFPDTGHESYSIRSIHRLPQPQPQLPLPPSHSLFLGCCFPRSLLVRPGTPRYVKIFVQQIYKIRYYTEVRCFQLTHEVRRQKEIDVLIVAQFKISLVRSVDIRHVV